MAFFRTVKGQIKKMVKPVKKAMLACLACGSTFENEEECPNCGTGKTTQDNCGAGVRGNK